MIKSETKGENDVSEKALITCNLSKCVSALNKLQTNQGFLKAITFIEAKRNPK